MTDALLHPFARPARPESSFIRVVRTEGAAIWTADGTRLVDGIANLWCCQIGHGTWHQRPGPGGQPRRMG